MRDEVEQQHCRSVVEIPTLVLGYLPAFYKDDAIVGLFVGAWNGAFGNQFEHHLLIGIALRVRRGAVKTASYAAMDVAENQVVRTPDTMGHPRFTTLRAS